MSSSWKIGDKVICIDSRPASLLEQPIPGLKAGEEYSIVDIHSCKARFIDVGLIPPDIFWMSHCGHCEHYSIGKVWNYARRFIKIDPDARKEILQELLNERRNTIHKIEPKESPLIKFIREKHSS